MAQFVNSCNGRYGAGYRLYLTVTENSTDIATNTSNVSIVVTCQAINNSYGNYGYQNPTTIYIDGNAVASNSPYTDYRNMAVNTLCSWQGNITHNNDGNKTINVSASFSSTSSSLSGGSVSGSVTLTYIPREAKITRADNFNDEQNPYMEFTNPGGFTINARLEFGGTSIQRSNIANTGNYTFQLTTEERNLLRSKTPNNNSLTVRFVIATYINSSTENYWNWHDRIMTIVNANPIFSNFTFEDINTTTLALTGDSSVNINGYSNIKATISNENKAEALKYATMSKYRFVIDNQSTDIVYADSESVYGTINNATSGIYNMYAIDSRGNTTLVTKAATNVINYQPITFNSLNCNVVRDQNGAGTNAILTIEGNIWNDNFGQVTNTIQNVMYEFKKTNSSTWITGTTSITPSVASDGTFTFSGQVGSDNQDYSWDLQSSYDFRITAIDELSSATIQLSPLSSAIPHISFADDGVGIMCDYDETIGGLLQVGGQRIV